MIIAAGPAGPRGSSYGIFMAISSLNKFGYGSIYSYCYMCVYIYIYILCIFVYVYMHNDL